MKAVPKIAAGVQIQPLDTPRGLAYRLRPTERGARGAGIVLPPRTCGAVMLVDGRRRVDEILTEMAAHGSVMKEPARVLALMRTLEAAGVVTLEHAFESPGPIRHECRGCGQSCEGHLVGPIEPAEAERLEAALTQLRTMDEHIPAGPATIDVEFEGAQHRVLHFVAGACIFLDPDKRCHLHRHLGPLEKPLPCRMFPIRMVRTETGTRVFISPRCFEAHKSYVTASETTADELLAQWGVWRPPAFVQGLRVDEMESLRTLDPAHPNRRLESGLLTRLDESSADFWELLAWVASVVFETPERDVEPPTPSQRLATSVLAFAAVRRILLTHFTAEREGRQTRFGASVLALLEGVASLDDASLENAAQAPLPEEMHRYALHTLRHFVFGREVMAFGSVARGVLVWALGVITAHLLTFDTSRSSESEPSCDNNVGHESGGDRTAQEMRTDAQLALDNFVRHATAWLRIMSAREVNALLFSGTSERDLLAPLAEDL